VQLGVEDQGRVKRQDGVFSGFPRPCAKIRLSIDAALVAEAEHEVVAARQNLAEAIKAWERAIHGLHPATLLLASAQRRLDRAHALLRAARGGTDNGVTKEEITRN
jgi:hypothetical protein